MKKIEVEEYDWLTENIADYPSETTQKVVTGFFFLLAVGIGIIIGAVIF